MLSNNRLGVYAAVQFVLLFVILAVNSNWFLSSLLTLAACTYMLLFCQLCCYNR